MADNTYENSPVAENEVTESVKGKKKDNQTPDRLLNPENPNATPFSVVEAYKNIRVQLTTILEKFGGKTIAISSPNASEGKSTTAVNIAITLSQLGKKVLIVDADIRRGTVHQKMKLENDKGCLDILAGTASFKECVKHYNSSLDVLTYGKQLSNSCELFDSSAFDELLIFLAKNYDYVIFDTPPVNLVSDALVISKKCDGLIYIIRSRVTTYEAFKKAKSSTDKLGVNTLGVIINAVDSGASKYYKYRYGRYGYSYHKRSYGYYGYYGRRDK